MLVDGEEPVAVVSMLPVVARGGGHRETGERQRAHDQRDEREAQGAPRNVCGHVLVLS